MSAPTRILPTDSPALFAAAVRETAERLRAGEVVAVPTETVYGLAANAWNPQAVERIFQIKDRPAHNPIIVHVASLDLARQCVASWPPGAEHLAAAFWPGPLTLVLPRSARVPDSVTAGGQTVGVRWPAHPFIQAVIRQCGFPLAAPSANRSTGLSPTTAEHVLQGLGGRIALIVDGGAAQVGIESTVLDLTVAPPRILRPGMIHAESLAAVLEATGAEERPPGASGMEEQAGVVPPRAAASAVSDEAGPLRSPGLLLKHYAPQASLLVAAWESEAELGRVLARRAWDPGRVHVIAHTQIPGGTAGLGRVCIIPRDAPAFARAIYAELHRCDVEGARYIVVEAVPEEPEWRGIRDRLQRAGHPGPP